MLKTAFLSLALLVGSWSAIAQTAEKPQEKPAQSSLDPKDRLAADIKAEALWDGRKIVPFRALDMPKMVKAQGNNFACVMLYIRVPILALMRYPKSATSGSNTVDQNNAQLNDCCQ